MTGNAGSENVASASASRSPSTAGAIKGEWKAPLTLRGITRLAPRALHCSPARCTPDGSPEITVWSGAFRLAGTATPSGPEASSQAACGHMGTVFAEAVTGRSSSLAQPLADNGEHGSGMGQNGGLSVVRQGKLVLGPFPHEAGQPGIERIVDGGKGVACGRKPGRQ